MRPGPYEVMIYNPNGMIDTHRPVVGEFTVDAIFAAMVERKWAFQSGGVYVAIKVTPDTREVFENYDAILTFTVYEREVVTVEHTVKAL